MLKKIVIGGLVSTAACIPVGADKGTVWSLSRSPLCVDRTNELDCARSIERVQLPEHPKVVWRSDDTLYAVTDRSTYRFVGTVGTDSSAQDSPMLDSSIPDRSFLGGYDPSARYTSFLHYFARLRLLLIHQIAGQDGHVLLIDAETGDTVKLPDCPQIGPSGARFLVATNFHLGHNELQIWRFRPFHTELVTGSHLWRVPRAVWRDVSSIEVTRAPTLEAVELVEGRLLPASDVPVLVHTDEWQEIPAQ